MERDHSSAINEHKLVIKQLNKKTDASMEGMKQQHVGAIAKVSSRFILVNLRNMREQKGNGKHCVASVATVMFWNFPSTCHDEKREWDGRMKEGTLTNSVNRNHKLTYGIWNANYVFTTSRLIHRQSHSLLTFGRTSKFTLHLSDNVSLLFLWNLVTDCMIGVH